MARNCGECLMNDVNIVELDETGKCPACGTDYGPEDAMSCIEPEPSREESETVKDYPPPDQNPDCRCYPNLHAAFFCMTGHLTECHYPMSCQEAHCSHLVRYIEPSEDSPAEEKP
jgi:hypothetical protein